MCWRSLKTHPKRWFCRCCVCGPGHIVCIYSIFGFVWPKKSPLPFLSVTLNHPSSLRIQMTWLHGPTVLAVRPPLSLSLSFNMHQSSFAEISWFALLLSYIWLCSFNGLITHLFWWNPLNLFHHANFDHFIDWSVNYFIVSISPNGSELNLMAVLCRCSWWQPRFPANFRPMFCQPVRQPQGVHRLQRSPRGAKPRKSYFLNCLLLFSAVSHCIEIMVEKRTLWINQNHNIRLLRA